MRRRALCALGIFWTALFAALVPGCKPAAPGAGSRAAVAGRSAPARALVARVIDGDSVRLADGREVRYLGIDTAEPGGPEHDRAVALNRRLVEGREVELEVPAALPQRFDRHGRLLALVWVDLDGRRLCVNEELLRAGVAWVYLHGPDDPPVEVRRELIARQVEAIEARRGLWKALDSWSARNLVATAYRIHKPDCRHLARARPRPVRSLEAELRAGRSPCRTCRPLW